MMASNIPFHEGNEEESFERNGIAAFYQKRALS